ncbi:MULTISPECIES: MOSC domain-containing protein [Clostridium]|uniref:MOSC domain protein n=2 Tax=Clostridium botulinum TaxID=1491 RepID=B2THM2_CLOBB|nr:MULTISPECIES: MOSC domain-containing protein [Clostridium]ACD24027.1 MOSC domain protein [Clostridium botulinum B str. Eklund 17B (NRP)]MBN1044790.1 MOSC domain-containing protein [Clostridium botulinum]MBN1051518.1 MOSC domain-containing protein [Clostridium botulinum]MBN1054746.1 MOSC domain-containing protein [Clostridium botulinum]MBY6975012.1 MOSC domain-containing protein [Clostridium botulinum]
MGKIMGICISEKRGTQKKRVDKANFIQDFGIENDAHAGKWHRQVSLLSYEKIEDFKAKGAEVNDGAFGENIIVQGFNLKALPIGSVLTCGNIILEITQIGKECHAHCEIYKKMGECIMPTNGVFAKVIEGGQMEIGDEIEITSGIGQNVLK